MGADRAEAAAGIAVEAVRGRGWVYLAASEVALRHRHRDERVEDYELFKVRLRE